MGFWRLCSIFLSACLLYLYMYEGVTQEVGGGRLGVKNCGRWEMGTPVSPPHV